MSGAPIGFYYTAGIPKKGNPVVKVPPVAGYSVQAEGRRPSEGQSSLPIFCTLAVIPHPDRDS